MTLGARFRIGITDGWRRRGPMAWFLLPLSGLYCAVVSLRHACYRKRVLPVRRFPFPIVVVGNLTVGGSGKTPLVVALANRLVGEGYRPGVVSRGYGGRARSRPQIVTADSDPSAAGDEAVLIARRTGCPVVVDPDRCRAVDRLRDAFHCDLVVSDDGLQHHRLGRSVEIIVIDGSTRFGNGFCLPAGPLRESASRVRDVDLVVCNGGVPADHEYRMSLRLGSLMRVSDFRTRSDIQALAADKVHAVAGIAHPQRFFNDLQRIGLATYAHGFPDHHRYSSSDFDFGDDLPIIMTEKDAVKCREFADSRMWFVSVTADVDETFYRQILSRLKRPNDRQETSGYSRMPRDQGSAHL